MKPSYGLALLLASISMAACGGTSSSTPVDSRESVAVLRILWPERPRMIPASANSLGVTISKGGVDVGYALIPRPTNGTTETSTTFNDLPEGTLDVAILAFPNADGTGVAQAAGGGTMTTAVDVPGAITISLVSTVYTLELTPTTNRVGKGSATTITASAKDSDNNVVLLSANGVAETLTWTSGTPAVLTLSGTGATVTANALTAGTSAVGVSFVSSDTGTVLSANTTLTVVATSGTVTIK